MKMTLKQALDAIDHGETPEQYEKRMKRIRRLANERDALIDAISVLEEEPRDPRVDKKKERLYKVQVMLEQLR